MRQLFSKRIIGGFLAVLLITSVTLAADPYKKADESWITITGNVASTVADKGRAGFTLDYGEGLITIEADDWDWDDDAAGLFPGERVTVTGRIDKDVFEKRSIEARDVYVHNRSTHYYASSADEENSMRYDRYAPTYYPVDGSWVTISGKVTEVDKDDKMFEIDTGAKELDIITKDLSYDPLDNIGIQKIRKGDIVHVHGVFDNDFFDEDNIVASAVVTVASGKAQS